MADLRLADAETEVAHLERKIRASQTGPLTALDRLHAEKALRLAVGLRRALEHWQTARATTAPLAIR